MTKVLSKFPLGVIALSLLVLSGCGLSKEQIAKDVKNSMQETFDSKPKMKDWHLTVTSVQVIEKGKNSYQGIVKVVFEGESHDVMVDITADKDTVAWKTSAFAFEFVTEKIAEEKQKIVEEKQRRQVEAERAHQRQLEERYARVATAVNNSQSMQLVAVFAGNPIKVLSKDEIQRMGQLRQVEELCSQAENGGVMGADMIYPGLRKACLEPSTAGQEAALSTPVTPAAPAPVAQTPPTVGSPSNGVSSAPIGSVGQGTPSFDCAKASSVVEELICARPDLATADAEMAAFYKKNIAESGANAAMIKQGQREFITTRNQCSTAACIAEAYRARHEELAQLGYVRE